MAFGMRRVAEIAAVGACVAIGAACAAARAAAPPQDPTGVWLTIDDKTGQTTGAVRIYAAGDGFNGRIDRVLDPKDAARPCEPCKGDRHNQPLLGLEIIRGLRPDGKGGWGGAEIVDPDTGNIYSASAKLDGGGDRLILRGYLLISLLGRSQTWLREK